MPIHSNIANTRNETLNIHSNVSAYEELPIHSNVSTYEELTSNITIQRTELVTDLIISAYEELPIHSNIANTRNETLTVNFEYTRLSIPVNLSIQHVEFLPVEVNISSTEEIVVNFFIPSYGNSKLDVNIGYIQPVAELPASVRISSLCKLIDCNISNIDTLNSNVLIYDPFPYLPGTVKISNEGTEYLPANVKIVKTKTLNVNCNIQDVTTLQVNLEIKRRSNASYAFIM